MTEYWVVSDMLGYCTSTGDRQRAFLIRESLAKHGGVDARIECETQELSARQKCARAIWYTIG